MELNDWDRALNPVKNTSRDNKPDEWLDADKDASLTITLNSEKVISSTESWQEEESGDKGEQALRVSWQAAWKSWNFLSRKTALLQKQYCTFSLCIPNLCRQTESIYVGTYKEFIKDSYEA